MHVFMSLSGLLWQQYSEQEWIRVRCVPFAVVTVWGCMPRKGVSDHGGVYPGGVCLRGVSALGLSAWGCLPKDVWLGRCLPRRGDVCPSGVCQGDGFTEGWRPPMWTEWQNDSCLWKHYLSATIVADGNGMHCDTWLEVNSILTNLSHTKVANSMCLHYIPVVIDHSKSLQELQVTSFLI